MKILTWSRWHADIKPDNVLYVEDRLKKNESAHGQNLSKTTTTEKAFKLADPGFAKFIGKNQHASHALPKATLWGGTKSYGMRHRLQKATIRMHDS